MLSLRSPWFVELAHIGFEQQALPDRWALNDQQSQ